MTTPRKRVYSEEQLAKQRIRSRKHYHAHKHEASERHKEYYLLHADELRAYSKKWKDDHREHVKVQGRRDKLRRNFGLTPQDFKSLVSKQEGKCAICGSTTPGGNRNWHVDHDHVTGKVRGLLCRLCNLMLGHSRDSSQILRAAISYLKSASEVQSKARFQKSLDLVFPKLP